MEVVVEEQEQAIGKEGVTIIPRNLCFKKAIEIVRNLQPETSVKVEGLPFTLKHEIVNGNPQYRLYEEGRSDPWRRCVVDDNLVKSVTKSLYEGPSNTVRIS